MKTLLSIKVDTEVKKKMKRFAEKIGIPLSTLINANLKETLREQRVSFALPLRPNAKTAKLLRRAHEDYKKGRNISPAFETAKDAVAYLRAQS